MAFSRLRWGAVLAIPAVLIGIGLVLWLRSSVPGKPIHVTYPLEGTLFPNDIVPPTFRWEDPSGVKQWRITFEFSDGGARITGDSDTPSWRPSKDQWDSIKKRSLEHDAQVAIHGVTGETRDKVLSRGPRSSTATSRCPSRKPWNTSTPYAGDLVQSLLLSRHLRSLTRCLFAAIVTPFPPMGVSWPWT
jgi:hypothetical protein